MNYTQYAQAIMIQNNLWNNDFAMTCCEKLAEKNGRKAVSSQDVLNLIEGKHSEIVSEVEDNFKK